MKILKLTANNFKKLSAVEITPDGNVVIISGKNAAGKSSVLDAIEAALCGGRSLPKQSIKIGEHRAEVTVVLGDENELGERKPEYKVTRKFFGQNSTLVVQAIGKTKPERSPQAFLDKIVGDISFDPTAFMKKTPAEQRSSMLDFLGLNLDEFNNKITSLKEERSDVRKAKETKLHEADSIQFTPNLPAEEQGADALLVELQTIQVFNSDRAATISVNAVATCKLESTVTDIASAQKAIEEWMKRISVLESKKKALQQQLTAIPEPKDTAEVEQKIATLNTTNEAIRRNIQKHQAMVDFEIHTEVYRELGDQVKITETNKALKMSQAVMPIKGLTIQSDGLAFEGIPLEQVNEAKKLEICVSIAMAMNPKLKDIRINGNDLDRERLLVIGQHVDSRGYRLWIEKVSDDNTIGFYIEDGTVVPRVENED